MQCNKAKACRRVLHGTLNGRFLSAEKQFRFSSKTPMLILWQTGADAMAERAIAAGRRNAQHILCGGVACKPRKQALRFKGLSLACLL